MVLRLLAGFSMQVTFSSYYLSFKVDMAPLAVRKSAYINVGGMDETVSEPGDCGASAVRPACLHVCVHGAACVHGSA